MAPTPTSSKDFPQTCAFVPVPLKTRTYLLCQTITGIIYLTLLIVERHYFFSPFLVAPTPEPEHTNVEPEHTNVEPEHTNVEPEHTNVEPEHTNVEPEHTNVQIKNLRSKYYHRKQKS